ncbi:VOC family protein [Micromonospora lupini]|uniref:VOC family protein n=1 Tax=Micromonospora lupini TaxID=285679 RepID=UPI0031DBD6C3
MTPQATDTAVPMMKKWLRGGLTTLAALQTVASVWQYVFPRSFYDDFPTVRLDPAYNEHLVSDVGGLGLALTAMLYLAAVVLDRKVVLSALVGYLIYAATHFTYHVTHVDHFSLLEALGVGTGLGIEVVLALLLLYLGRLVHRAESAAVPSAALVTGPASQRPPEWRNPRSESAPDFANLPAPAEGILVTLFITVRDVARSRDFYAHVLGGTVVLNENPCIVRLSNSWIIMNPGGPPTPDKPGISVVDYQPGDTTSIFLNLRVADIRACYEQWTANGAQFLTPPIDRKSEIRCYLRDPDGYLIEIGQSTGLLQGKRARTHPHDPTS